MFQIGLTGGICTGKSYVLAIFAELGCYTFQADELAKKIIFSSDSKIARQLISLCGGDVGDKNGGLCKEKFARLLFEDAEKRNAINHIVHPLVVKERLDKIKEIEKMNIYDFFVYESALLVESGTFRDFKKIIVVYASPEEQIKRLMQRDGVDHQAAEKKIQAQFPLKEKLKVADYTIDSSGSFENTRINTLEVFHLLQKDLQPR